MISDKTIPDAFTIKQEISGIENVLRKRYLDVVCIAIPGTKSLHKFWEKKGGDLSIPPAEFFSAGIKAYLEESLTELSASCNEGTKLGVDISTEWISFAAESDIQLLLTALDEYNSSCPSISAHSSTDTSSDSSTTRTTDSTQDRITTSSSGTPNKSNPRRIDCISLATNFFTFKKIGLIHSWASERGAQSF